MEEYIKKTKALELIDNPPPDIAHEYISGIKGVCISFDMAQKENEGQEPKEIWKNKAREQASAAGEMKIDISLRLEEMRIQKITIQRRMETKISETGRAILKLRLKYIDEQIQWLEAVLNRHQKGHNREAGIMQNKTGRKDPDKQAAIRKQNEKTKEWLWRYRDAKKDTRRLLREYDETTKMQETCRAIQYSGMPKGGAGLNDLSECMVQREEIHEKLMDKICEKDKTFREICDTIENLETAEEREVMSLRYLQLDDCRPKEWEEIATVIGCSQRQVHNIHGRALKRIGELLKVCT